MRGVHAGHLTCTNHQLILQNIFPKATVSAHALLTKLGPAGALERLTVDQRRLAFVAFLAQTSSAGMGEPESEEAHHERASTRELSGVHAPAAEKDDQLQHDRHHDKQDEHYEANDGPPVNVHPGPRGSSPQESAVLAEPGQRMSAEKQHVSRDLAHTHVTDGTLESSGLSAGAARDENHPTERHSQEQAYSPTMQPTLAADSASNHATLQPASVETEQQHHSISGQYHQLSYNGASTEADMMLHTAAVPDRLSDQPGAIPEVAGSKQPEQSAAGDSPSKPEERDGLKLDGGTKEGGRPDEAATSNLAGTGTAEVEGFAPEEEAERTHHDDDGIDDDWGDDFGGFEEAAGVAEEQPSTQAAEHVAAAPPPEAPVEAEVSDTDALFSSSPVKFLQAVSRQLVGSEYLSNEELLDVSSTSIDNSLQQLADKLHSLTPEASELTQKALQIGTPQKRAQSVEPIAWAGSDTEAAFLLSLPLRQRASDQSELPRPGDDSDKAAGAASRGPSYNSQEAGEASSLSTKHADMQGRGSGFAPAQVRVGMEGSVESGGGGDSAALRALVKRLPDLSYMLSDSLVRPPRTR